MVARSSSRPLLCLSLTGVILAASGCAIGHSTGASATSAAPADPGPRAQADSAAFAEFSDNERERILAVRDIVEEAAAEHELDPDLLYAMIWVESRFDPRAKSPAGARGLMQLMPSTAAYLAKRMGVRAARSYDPEFNVRAGALYLAEMIARFEDEAHAVAAYHAGPGNVKRWLADGEDFPDYSQAYVAKVMEARSRFAAGVPERSHGRGSGARSAAPIVELEAEAPREPTPPGSEPEPLEAPDPENLPDAAEIHGIERVIYEGGEDDERSKAKSKPEPQPEPEPEPEPEPDYEPVFEPHPELDAHPSAPPPGWSTPSEDAPAEDDDAPAEDPDEPAEDDAPAEDDDALPDLDDRDAGLGVLPDL